VAQPTLFEPLGESNVSENNTCVVYIDYIIEKSGSVNSLISHYLSDLPQE